MWRRKKFIAIVLATVLVVGGSVGVVLAADDGDGNGSPPEAQHVALLDKVCAIYEENTDATIDPQALQDAFAQARSEMRDEALKKRLEHMEEQGRITEGEAGEYLEWWQSKPDVPLRFGFKCHSRLGGWGQPCVPRE
jgi:hypothetical protein